MDNQNMNNVKLALLGLAIAISLPGAAAVELGMNYYHESMMGSWGGQYIPRSDAEINSDLDDIKSVSRHIKLYANPMVDGNVDHMLKIARMARDKGFHVVVTMNTEDRQLNDGNWGEYRNRVLNACPRFNGVANEFIVGNEIALHSPWDSHAIRDRVVPLMNECSFNGPKNYEAFFWARDAWRDYDRAIYLNMYEHYPLFAQNIDEIKGWRHTPIIGEWGDNFGSEENQAYEIRKRWDKIKETNTPVAYVFTYKEPSPSGTFGVLRNDGTKKPAWYALPNSGNNQQTTTPQQTTPTTSGFDIGQLRATFTAHGGSQQKQDTVMGDCRAFTYGTNAGDARVLACKRGAEVEMFAQSTPGTNWKFTLSSGSVGSHTGYARFVPSEDQQGTPSTPNAPTTSTGSTLANYQVSFEGGSKVSDTFNGCRNLAYSTSAGEARVLACEKDGQIEMFAQSTPNTQWRLTMAGGSVGSHTGYAKFTPNAGATQQTTPPTTTTSTPSANGWSATPNGRIVKNEDQGSCKRAAFETDAGYIEALTCDKGGVWEMYLQSPVNGAQISRNGLTVGSNNGFARG